MTSLTSEELDHRISRSIAHATSELRDEFRAQLLEIRRGSDSTALLEGLRKIDAAETQADILRALLVATEPYSPGAAVLLNTPDGLRGWGMRGLHGSSNIESVQLPVDPSSPWGRVAAGNGVIRTRVDDFYASLGGASNEEHTLVPLILRGQVAAVLATEGGEDIPALQTLTYGASQAIETLAVRSQGMSPTLSAATASETVQEAAHEAPAAEPVSAGFASPDTIDSGGLRDLADGPPAAPPIESPAIQPPAIETQPELQSNPLVSEEWAQEPAGGPAPAPPISDPAPPVYEPAPQPAPSPFEDDLRTVAVSQSPLESAPAPAPPIAAPVSTEVSPPAEMAMAADGQIIPPEDVEGPGWAFSNSSADSDSSGNDAVHDEARRLARLLVSEIKLYNEEQVEEGRQNGNIYSRLREDIDRSQQIYEERIHPTIRGKTDFFRDELVRILAAGDSDVLGM